MTSFKTNGVKSMRRLIIASALSTGLFFTSVLPALAANPPGTGQPSQSCQSFGAAGAPLNVNGFNTTGFGHATTVYAGSPGTTSLANGNAHAVSQYDVACLQQSTH
jgi:hypothetical protein